jgi:hypothetical protein
LNGIQILRLIECPLKMMNVQGDQAPAKRQKMLKKSENSCTKTIAEQSMSSQTPLGSVMDEKDRNFGATTTGSVITTTRPPTRP